MWPHSSFTTLATDNRNLRILPAACLVGQSDHGPRSFLCGAEHALFLVGRSNRFPLSFCSFVFFVCLFVCVCVVFSSSSSFFFFFEGGGGGGGMHETFNLRGSREKAK